MDAQRRPPEVPVRLGDPVAIGTIPSPVRGLRAVIVAATSRGVRAVRLVGENQDPTRVRESLEVSLGAGGAGRSGAAPVLARALAELGDHLRGGSRDFSSAPDLEGLGSPFERAVWAALRKIPRGETRTYGELAAMAGKPGAARAVGRACGRNPVPVIVPCHRVLGADGSLTGFTGGLELKKVLLGIEGIAVDRPSRRNHERCAQ